MMWRSSSYRQAVVDSGLLIFSVLRFGRDVDFDLKLLVAGLGGVVEVSGPGGRLDPAGCEAAVAEFGVGLPGVGVRVEQELPVPLGCA
eukprot:6262724-Pyramimonas_sp.AAC.1